MMSSWVRALPTAVVIAGAACAALSLAVGAFAQTEPPPVAESGLGDVMDVRAAGNDAAVEAQTRIDAVSDETSDLLSRYRTVLKQIEAIDLYNAQMADMIAAAVRQSLASAQTGTL